MAKDETWGPESVPTFPTVARPDRWIFAPVTLGVLLDGITVAMCVFSLIALGANGFVLFSIPVVHFVAVSIGIREPQIDNLIKARVGMPHFPRPQAHQRARYPGSRVVFSP